MILYLMEAARTRWTLGGATMMLALLAGAPVTAQVMPASMPMASRPSGKSSETLTLSANAAAGYDDNLLASDVSGASAGPGLAVGGSYASTDLGVSYGAESRAVSFGANGFSS